MRFSSVMLAVGLAAACRAPGPSVIDHEVEVGPVDSVAPWSGPYAPRGWVRYTLREPTRQVGGPIFQDFEDEVRLAEAVRWTALVGPDGSSHPVGSPSSSHDLRLKRDDGALLEPAGAWTLLGELAREVPADLIGLPIEAPFEVIDPRDGFDRARIPADFDALFHTSWRSGRARGSMALVADIFADSVLIRLSADPDGLLVRAYFLNWDDSHRIVGICRGDTTVATLSADGHAVATREHVAVEGRLPLRLYDLRYQFGLDGDLVPGGVEVSTLIDVLDLAPAFGDEPRGSGMVCALAPCLPCPADPDRTCAMAVFHDYQFKSADGVSWDIDIQEPADLDDAPLCQGPRHGEYERYGDWSNWGSWGEGSGWGEGLCSTVGPVTVGGWLLGVALLLRRRRTSDPDRRR